MKTDGPRLLTVAAAAAQLAVDPETIRRHIRAGRLACHKFGGCIRISHEQLQTFLDEAECRAGGRKNVASDGEEEAGASDSRIAAALQDLRWRRTVDRAIRKIA